MSLDKLTRTEPSLRYQYLILTPINVYSRHYSTKILEETLHSSVLTANEREREVMSSKKDSLKKMNLF